MLLTHSVDIPPDSGTDWVETDAGAYLLVDNERALRRCLSSLQEASLVAFDTEASSLDAQQAHPLLAQFAVTEDGESLAYVVVLPAFRLGPLLKLFATLADGHCLVVGHNIGYDYKIVRAHYGSTLTRMYDTQLAERLLTSGDYDQKAEWLSQTSLKAVVRRYLGQDIEKDTRESFYDFAPPPGWVPTEEQTHYAALDVLLLLPLFTAQLQRVKDEGLVKAARLRFAAIGPVGEMELHGMRVDVPGWRAWLATQAEAKREAGAKLVTLLTPGELAYQKAVYHTEMDAYTAWEAARDRTLLQVEAAWTERRAAFPDTMGWGEWKNLWMKQWRAANPNPGKPKPLGPDFEINLRSPEQVKRALTSLGLEEVSSTDKEARAKLLLRKNVTPEQRVVLETFGAYTLAAHNESSFGENILARVRDGRLRGSYNIHIAETGRMSSEKPNFQNFPRDKALRACFIADEDGVVVTADYKSQELCISAALSGDEVMKADLAAGRDLYKQLATEVYGVAYDDVTDEQRRVCKAALLGITYGQTDYGLEQKHDIPRPMGKRVLAGIRGRYTQLVAWSDQQTRIAGRWGYVLSASGAKRYFRDGNMPEWKRNNEARNGPVQGTAADVMYRALARLDPALPAGCYLGNVVHDEVVVCGPASYTDALVRLIPREMAAAFDDLLPYARFGVVAGADIHVSTHWEKG